MTAWRDRNGGAPFRGRRVEGRARRRRILRRAVVLFLCGGFLVLVWLGTRMQSLTITEVTVSGGVTIDHAKVEAAAQSALDGNYFFLIPKQFSYFYPHDAVASAVSRVSRVERVTVARVSHSALSVTIMEYVPFALWCAYGNDGRDVGDACLFVSAEGLAFASAPSLSGATFLRYMTEGNSPEVGILLASDDYMKATKEFAHALLERHGMHILAIIETKDGDVWYRLRGGGELLVSKDADMRAVFENLDAILASKEFAHIKSGGFNYIDLRFGEKVFVKEFADAPEKEQEATSTEAAAQ